MKQIVAGVAIILAFLGLGILLVVGNLNEADAPRSGGGGGAGAITTISHGDRVRIDDHLGSGLTVVEFYADW